MNRSLWNDEEPEPDPEFRSVWADADEDLDQGASAFPEHRPPSLKPITAAEAAKPVLLKALSDVEFRLGRLDAMASVASSSVREGLIARIGFREAAGWLTQASQWIDPIDLALRADGLTENLTAAAKVGNLASALPVTLEHSGEPEDEEVVPEDRTVDLALALARHYRTLASTPSWKPLQTASDLSQALDPLGLLSGSTQALLTQDWINASSSPDPEQAILLAAFDAANRWRTADEGDNSDEVDARAGFIAAAWMMCPERLQTVPLPIWSARAMEHRTSGSPFFRDDAALLALLSLIGESISISQRELVRLQTVERKALAAMAATNMRGSNKLPAALDLAIKRTLLTPKTVCGVLDVSDRASTGLMAELVKLKVVRETTRRKRYRAFVL